MTYKEAKEYFESDAKDMDQLELVRTQLAIEALDKQIPKEIVNSMGFIYCPNCNKYYGTLFNMSCIKRKDKYCQKCGQKLDWSKINGVSKTEMEFEE